MLDNGRLHRDNLGGLLSQGSGVGATVVVVVGGNVVVVVVGNGVPEHVPSTHASSTVFTKPSSHKVPVGCNQT